MSFYFVNYLTWQMEDIYRHLYLERKMYTAMRKDNLDTILFLVKEQYIQLGGFTLK